MQVAKGKSSPCLWHQGITPGWCLPHLSLRIHSPPGLCAAAWILLSPGGAGKAYAPRV